MKSDIFGVYDVRGIYPKTINEAVVSKVGRVAASILLKGNRSGSLVVGHDARLSSPSLYKALIASLRAASPKTSLHLAGLITTPEMSYLVNSLKSSGGLMVTASHNPKQYNGVKLVKAKGVPVNGKEIYAIYKKLR